MFSLDFKHDQRTKYLKFFLPTAHKVTFLHLSQEGFKGKISIDVD
jgi:hypothetical protein